MKESNQPALYEVVSQDLLDKTIVRARQSPRKRINYNLHKLEDVVQRLLIAMEPGTYVQPHRHLNPPKCETFIVLRGRLAIIIFDDTGAILDTLFLSPSEHLAVDMKPGCWHSVVALAAGTVVIEAKNGPYDPINDKDFASWAPSERDEECHAYLAKLRDHVQSCD